MIQQFHLRTKHTPVIHPSIPCLNIYVRKIKTCSHKKWYVNAYSDFIHNDPNLETTQMCFSWWDVNCSSSCNGILLGNKKELITDLRNKIDRFQMHYALWKKPDSKGYVLYDSIYITSWKGKTVRSENRSVVARGWGWKEELTLKGMREFWRWWHCSIFWLCW